MNYLDEFQGSLFFFNDEHKLVKTLIFNIIHKLDEYYLFQGNFKKFQVFLDNKINLNTNFWKQIIQLIEKWIDNENIEWLKFDKNDELGSKIQRDLDSETRKKIAANYTTLNSTRLLIENLPKREFKKIIDPFCGSGRLILEYLDQLPTSKTYPEIYISDNHFSAVVLAYFNILTKFIERKEDLNKINVDYGDSFSLFNKNKIKSKYDLVLINPPFTRVHRFDKKQSMNLKWLENKFQKLLQGQPGLHIYSFLLSDLLLNADGVIAAVLPLATFTSDYSKELNDYILNKFGNIKFINSKNTISFSEDSNIREILAIFESNPASQKIEFLKFSLLNNQWSKIDYKQYLKDEIKDQFNFALLLNSDNAIRLMRQLLISQKIETAKTLKIEIIRGLEMYGPNYFFLPNNIWKIKKIENSQIIISNGFQLLNIQKSALKLALRKPGLYLKNITPNVNEYILDIQEEKQNHYSWLQTYNSITENYAQAAKRKFGKTWINHTNHQIKNKEPYSHVFFVDKFSILTTSIMCHYTDDKITCSKNFYLIKGLSSKESKLLAAWINSTVYLFLFLLQRREIGGSYGRMQISDLKKYKMFFDIFIDDTNKINKIRELFDQYRKLSLETIPNQLNNGLKRKIDLIFLDLLGIKDKENFLQDLNFEIKEILDDLKLRDIRGK